MLEDIIVVQSAVSAFNNMALWMPAFFFYSLLMVPLFVMVYMYGNDFVSRFGWNSSNMLQRVSVSVVVFVFAWIMLFGGNYGVLRDGMSSLPILNALILFLCSLFIMSHVGSGRLGLSRARFAFLLFVILLLAGVSGMPTWYGVLLQVGAVLLGGFIGWVAKTEMRPISGVVLILLTTIVAILMQPEFFRFGQLGNLTVLHLFALVLVGVLAIAVLVVSGVKCAGRIKPGVYIKIKWLMRVICMLCVALFLFTEAVPVYLAMLLCFAALFSVSVWHMKAIDIHFVNTLFGMMLMIFGVVTVMPVISALGIVFAGKINRVDFVRDIKQLL